MQKLNDQEIQSKLQHLDTWQYAGNALVKTFTFKDFQEAFAFMNRVAVVAEQQNHHPDWSNVYNKVSFKLNTHTESGVTEKDFELLREIENAGISRS